jgi:hypothetical protein
MTTKYGTWYQTRMAPPTKGGASTSYETPYGQSHAVLVDNEVPATWTICGQARHGGEINTEQPFDAVFLSVRCPDCATKLGLPYV